MAAAAFARIDADNNGLLDIAELGAALGILGLEGAQQPTPARRPLSRRPDDLLCVVCAAKPA